jgi:hypothetical protein
VTARLYDSTTTADPIVRGILILTMAALLVGTVALVRAAVGGRVQYLTVRVDNQTGLAVRVDALDASGARIGLGEAKSKALRTFLEVPDIGSRWTLVASYGGQEVFRETLARTELADRNWTVTIPPEATASLERAGFR